MNKLILISLCLLWAYAATSSYAAIWTVHDPLYVAQNDPGYSEVLPAEDMDPNHTITWGPSGAVKFWPSWAWDTPQPGDIHCWLYDQPSPTIAWWQGTFNNPSTSIGIQLPSCNGNDGWADIYVDGILETSYNSYHAVGTDVMLVGQGLANIAHTVEIRTRGNGGDIHLDYVAYPAIPEPITIALLALGGLFLSRHRH